ncbi:MAG: hypothetical protein M1827_004520 [Pycnora praestabilis]|nr:MAG: hypothetical protein M1827_004520 [Pycnora praestabilis]
MTPYQPTSADVAAVRNLLSSPTKSISVPLEVVDIILDHACYWLRTTITMKTNVVATGGADKYGSNKLCLRTYPLGLRRTEGSVDEQEILTPADDAGPSIVSKVKDAFWKVLNLGKQLAPVKKSSKTKGEVLWLPPRGRHPCRKIVFQIWSHDQGWSGEDRNTHGTYHPSYTWMDVHAESTSVKVDNSHESLEDPLTGEADKGSKIVSVIESYIPWENRYHHLYNDRPPRPPRPPRPSRSSSSGFESIEPFKMSFHPKLAKDQPFHPFLPPQTRLQSNLQSTETTTHHTITWSYDDGIDEDDLEADGFFASGRGKRTLDGAFVRSLDVGDCVTLWARARFPGWSNTVEAAKIEVFWAV